MPLTISHVTGQVDALVAAHHDTVDILHARLVKDDDEREMLSRAARMPRRFT